MKELRTLFHILTVVAVLGGGAGIFGFMLKTREKPPQEETVELARLVEVVPARAGDYPRIVYGQGTVMPARQVALSAEVSGRVVWQSPKLMPGGPVREGEPLVRLDARDYQLALAQQEAQVERARLELEVEESRGAIAKKEWALMGKGEGGTLALRTPQLRSAKNSLEAAQSGVDRAKLAVSRTSVRAPFNALVVTEQVEVGQLLGPGTPIAQLVGTDHFWVQVAIPIEELEFLTIPGHSDGAKVGSSARILQSLGDDTIERTGRVLRLQGDLDPAGQMARLVVEIDDPLGTKSGAKLPLLLGAFVKVELDGGVVEGGVALPRVAVRGGDEIFVMTAEDTLELRTIDPVLRTREAIIVKEGLGDGERVIVGRVPAPVPGMALRVKSETTSAETPQVATTAPVEAPPGKPESEPVN